MNGLFSTLFGFAGPYIQDGIATVVTAGAVWLFTMLNSKLGINIETARRDALTASAKRVAGELFTEVVAGHVNLGDLFTTAIDGSVALNPSHPVIAAKVAKVQAAAPDAIKALGLGGKNTAGGIGVIASKILGELGPLLAASGGALGPIGGLLGALSAGPAATVAVR